MTNEFMKQEIHKGFPCFYADSPAQWRNWLAENCEKEKSVWLILYKKDAGFPSMKITEAIDEALCYGWVDSKSNTRDENSYYLYFSKRNPKSNWSRINKNKIQRLIDSGKLAKQGHKMVELAKASGTWDALNEVEDLVIPADLMKEFQKFNSALKNWNNFPDSSKRGILEWIFNAKRSETRKKRIDETASLANQNIRANQFTKK